MGIGTGGRGFRRVRRRRVLGREPGGEQIDLPGGQDVERVGRRDVEVLAEEVELALLLLRQVGKSASAMASTNATSSRAVTSSAFHLASIVWTIFGSPR
jgi:hypothetical protein